MTIIEIATISFYNPNTRSTEVLYFREFTFAGLFKDCQEHPEKYELGKVKVLAQAGLCRLANKDDNEELRKQLAAKNPEKNTFHKIYSTSYENDWGSTCYNYSLNESTGADVQELFLDDKGQWYRVSDQELKINPFPHALGEIKEKILTIILAQREIAHSSNLRRVGLYKELKEQIHKLESESAEVLHDLQAEPVEEKKAFK